MVEEIEIKKEDIPVIQSDKDLELSARAAMSMEAGEDRKATVTPVDIVENSVATFLGKAIEATLYSNKLSQALEDSLTEDLPNMSTNEKITLYNIEKSSSNDRLFKMLSPTIGLITARQQALIQATAKEAQNAAVQINVQNGAGNARDAAVASSADPAAIAGLNTIFQLIAAKAGSLKKEESSEV